MASSAYDTSYYAERAPSSEYYNRYSHMVLPKQHFKYVYINDMLQLTKQNIKQLFKLRRKLLIVDTETYNRQVTEEDPRFLGYDSKGKYEKLRECRLVQVYSMDVDINTVFIFDMGLLEDCGNHSTGGVPILSHLADLAAHNYTIYHNSSFDLAVLKSSILPLGVEDTLYLARLAFPLAKSKGLAALAKGLGLEDVYSTEDGCNFDKSLVQKSNWSTPVLSPTQLRYAAADCIVTAHVFFNKNIQRARQRTTYKLDCHNARYASIFQQNKMYTHVEDIEKGIVEDKAKIVEYKKVMADLGYATLNVNSSKQCVAAMQAFDRTVTSSDKQALVTMANEGTCEKSRLLADTIFKLRRALKSKGMLSKYRHGWVVSNYDVGGANTGRYTSKGAEVYRGVNTQQIPRARRNMFIPQQGNKIVGADYPTIELRVIASLYPNIKNALSKWNPALSTSKLDKFWNYDVSDTMYTYLMKDIDLHKATAHNLSGIPLDDIDAETRFKAKAANFGLKPAQVKDIEFRGSLSALCA